MYKTAILSRFIFTEKLIKLCYNNIGDDSMDRPILDKNIDSKTFREYYYLKEELVKFCRDNNLQTTGSKAELTNRITRFLDTGEREISIKKNKKTNAINEEITLDSIIEENFVCSEDKREFFQKEIGKSFSFNVLFQKWLKSNSGKTYRDAIDAYYKIKEDKKNTKTTIDSQFEYNNYIRDFFADNKVLSLDDAIKCWNYKKSQKGSNKYDKSDRKVLK